MRPTSPPTSPATGRSPVDLTTLEIVGKVVAVHLSYLSRAAQGGRAPEHPSYFPEAASSLSLSGIAVERPAGTEPLAFEGEIALVIGSPHGGCPPPLPSS